MSAGFNLADYVDVAERERLLFERYPDARIQVDLVEVRDEANRLTGWAAKATIWRTPEDAVPVCDWAVEPVPGKTPYTRDSEAMNASTSAVGRAIVLAGFPTKKIASAEEVLARQSAGEPRRDTGSSESGPSAAPAASPAESVVSKAKAAQEAAKAARAPQSGDPGDILVGFGKHKDEKLSDVPKAYLEWIVNNIEGVTPHKKQILARAYVLLGRESEFFANPDDDIPF